MLRRALLLGAGRKAAPLPGACCTSAAALLELRMVRQASQGGQAGVQGRSVRLAGASPLALAPSSARPARPIAAQHSPCSYVHFRAHHAHGIQCQPTALHVLQVHDGGSQGRATEEEALSSGRAPSSRPPDTPSQYTEEFDKVADLYLVRGVG